MTREDVKAQLAKCPLEWSCTDPFDRDGEKVVDHYAELMEVSADADVFYTIREVFEDDGKRVSLKLYLVTMDATQQDKAPYRVLICEKDIPLEDMKQLAEEERVKSACRMLGIKDSMNKYTKNR